MLNVESPESQWRQGGRLEDFWAGEGDQSCAWPRHRREEQSQGEGKEWETQTEDLRPNYGSGWEVIERTQETEQGLMLTALSALPSSQKERQFHMQITIYRVDSQQGSTV